MSALKTVVLINNKEIKRVPTPSGKFIAPSINGPAVITWRPDAPKPGTPEFDRWLKEQVTK
jgi:hypothetical protein